MDRGIKEGKVVESKEKGYVIKLFCSENQYSSVEISLGLNDQIDEAKIQQLVSLSRKYVYTPPKWPEGMICPKCSKGTITYRQFQSKKNGQTYSMYGCSDKECKFAAWADINTKIPREEPWHSKFLAVQHATTQPAQQPVAHATQAQAAPYRAPVQQAPAQAPAQAPVQQDPYDPGLDESDLPF